MTGWPVAEPGKATMRAGAISLGLALSSIATAVGAETFDCGNVLLDGGTVVDAIDARTIRLHDGRDIRLSGIEIPDDATAAATVAALRSTLIGKEVMLTGEADMPDRYGRQHAYAIVDDNIVQLALLREGLALRAFDTSGPCHLAMVRAEGAAKSTARGIWTSDAIKNAESSGKIRARLGQYTVISGRVLSVRASGATTYLNFGVNWTRDFSATISKRALAEFSAAGLNASKLKGRQVWLRGWVEQRSGPRLRLTHPGQIEVTPTGEPSQK